MCVCVCVCVYVCAEPLQEGGHVAARKVKLDGGVGESKSHEMRHNIRPAVPRV